jgi:hypothetical protein
MEGSMLSVSCRAAILLVVAIVGPAAAGEVAEQFMTKFAVAPSLPDKKETTGSVDRLTANQSLPLSDEQRGLIFLGIINLPDTPEAELSAPLTSTLPDRVELYDLPAMLVRRIPLLQGHKFVKLDDRILVVRPSDRIVVAEIPRYRLLP